MRSERVASPSKERCFLETFDGDESLNLVKVANCVVESIAALGSLMGISEPQVQTSIQTEQFLRVLEASNWLTDGALSKENIRRFLHLHL